MKLSLYKIEQEYLELAQQLLDNGGELTDELSERLNINEQNLQTKGINYGFIVKQMESDVEVIDSEIKRLTALKASRNKSIDRLKDTLSKAMELYAIEKIETPVLKINFRNSESIEIENIDLVDNLYKVEKTIISADKKAIKEAIKSGEEVAGAILKQNKNLQIK